MPIVMPAKYANLARWQVVAAAVAIAALAFADPSLIKPAHASVMCNGTCYASEDDCAAHTAGCGAGTSCAACASSCGSSTCTPALSTGTTTSTGSTTAPAPAGRVRLDNPLAGGDSIQAIVGKFTKIFLGVSGSFALLMFVYGGFMWVTSGGNMDKVKKGKQVFTYATIGLIVIYGSYIALAALLRVLQGAGP